MIAITTLTAWAWAATFFTWVALYRISRWRKALAKGTPVRTSSPAPAILLLRPVDAPTAEERLRLGEQIDYPGSLEQVVLSPYRLRLPESVRWLPSDPPTRNRKVGHVVYGLRVLEAEGALEERFVLRSLAEGLASGAALTTAAPEPELELGAGVGSSWSARAWRSLLLHTHHSFVALHAMSAGSNAVCGKALGLGAMAQEILPDLAGHAGEDLELSKRVRARGGVVSLVAAPARVPQDPAASAREVLSRLTRWMQVLRAQRPQLYPAVPLLCTPTLPLILAALYLGIYGDNGDGIRGLLTAVSALVISRIALSLLLRGGTGLEWLSGEALLGAAFLQSLTTRRLCWRGRHYALLRGGRMEPDSDSAS